MMVMQTKHWLFAGQQNIAAHKIAIVSSSYTHSMADLVVDDNEIATPHRNANKTKSSSTSLHHTINFKISTCNVNAVQLIDWKF